MDRHWLNSDEPWRNPDGSVNYPEYINSQEWRRRRRAYLKKYALCNRCGMDNDEHKRLYGTALHVHHVSYARVGAELDEDLEALCKKCHEAEECEGIKATWAFRSGSGKLKGIKGKGTYQCKAAGDVNTCDVEGEYTLPK